jgi:membrane protease YdiL (CAAX protease family)
MPDRLNATQRAGPGSPPPDRDRPAPMNRPIQDRPRLNPAGVLCGYLLGVFLGGALLAPWLWSLAQTVVPGSGLAQHPFRRYVDRSLLGLALLGIWPMARAGWFPGWRRVGFSWGPCSARELVLGLSGGVASLAAVAALALGLGARSWLPHPPAGLFMTHLVRAVGAAVAVSFLEELLFRGMVFGSLRRRYSFAVSATLSSGLFAMIHFFRRPDPPASVGPWTGFEMLGRMLGGWADVGALFPGILTLGMIGGLLAWCRERTGSLWLPFGLHAGWIFWFKSYQFLTVATARGDRGARWWGSIRLHDGWATFVVLALTAVVFVRALGKPKAGDDRLTDG